VKRTDDEQVTISRILELAAQGDKIRSIIHRLAVEGHRTTRGWPWAREAVQRVLKTMKKAKHE